MVRIEHCIDCLKDKKVFCPRDVDAQCKDPVGLKPPVYIELEPIKVKCPECGEIRSCDTDPETMTCNECLEKERI